MTTNAPEHDRTFTTSTGRTFTVRYIPQGSPLFSTTHRITPAPTPAVEFYDASAIGTPAALGHPAGQFTGVTAYISDDGRTLTTWPGIELAHVINHRPGRTHTPLDIPARRPHLPRHQPRPRHGHRRPRPPRARAPISA